MKSGRSNLLRLLRRSFHSLLAMTKRSFSMDKTGTGEESLYIRGHKTAALRSRMERGRSVFRSEKPRALARGASFSTVGVFSGVNSINDNTGHLKVKADTVFPDSESMGGRRQINQRFSKGQRIPALNVQLNLFNDSPLQLDRKFFEFPFSAGSEFNLLKHNLNQDNPNSCLIFSKGT